MNKQSVLLTIQCPAGTKVVIEGRGEAVVKDRKNNLFLTIACAMAIIDHKGVTVSVELLERVTLIKIDEGENLVKVSIAPVRDEKKKAKR